MSNTPPFHFSRHVTPRHASRGKKGTLQLHRSLTSLCAALGVFLLVYVSGHPWLNGNMLALLDASIVATLFFHYTYFYHRQPYVFSSSFWVAAFAGFYFVLKSFEFADSDTTYIEIALAYCLLFLFAYTAGYAASNWIKFSKHGGQEIIVLRERKFLYACFAIFVGMRLAGFLLVRWAVGDSYTQLDLAVQTQNQGMAYLFKILEIGRLAFWSMAAYCFVTRRHFPILGAAALIVLADAVSNASRSTVIFLVLGLLFLYGRFIRRVPYVLLAALLPLLITVVAFFGYVRNIDVGNAAVYTEAVRYFSENPDFVWQLFMQRMDLLPSIAQLLEMRDVGNPEFFWGSSYINAFLHIVPRTLWPEKAPLSAAYMSMQVAPGAFAEGVNLYPSVFMEGYLNFGLAGVVLSGIMVGLLSRMYDRWMRSRSFFRLLLYLAFFTFPLGLLDEGVHSNYFADVLYTATLLTIMLSLFRASGIVRWTRRPRALV